ncbi:DUF397 domain-containing protein [Streptomyces albus]|uniref:DUF397 domain-containing protein n=1 Tax=Streptomyces albus TaxID=1888 RepID=UPI0024ACEC1C|nr:DUF397 domain-containing protein [Streptomyces albus]MDI6410519.1 DUF397 domain-containing protein [Streptomyces albus]
MKRKLLWHKSSYSGSSGSSDCVEDARTSAAVHVRDSKRTRGPILSVPSGQWAVFVRHVAGER